MGAQALDSARIARWTKVLHRQEAQLVVNRGIEDEETGPVGLVRWPRYLSGDALHAVLIGARARIGQQGADQIVVRDDEAATLLNRDRCLAQLRVQRIRVRAVGVVENLLED